MSTFEELQEQLEKQIADLDAERKTNAQNFEKERKQLIEYAAMERARQLEEYTRKVEEHAKRQADKEAQEQERSRAALSEKIALEQKEFELSEILRQQRERLAWLENQISNAEFSEEQHRKILEDQKNMILHPEPPPEDGSKPAEAATGTDGDTHTELMSEHLKKILRQAQRSY